MEDRRMKNSKPTVVTVGLFISGNSFTRVFETLFAKLAKYFDIHWLGIAYKGEKRKEKNYTLYPCNLQGGDMYGAYGAVSLAEELGAKQVLLLNDFYLLRNYEFAWRRLKETGVRLLAYVPVDGEITDFSIVQEAFFLDNLVLYNQWAKDEVVSAFEKFHPSERTADLPALNFIYHGVDRRSFYPLPEHQSLPELKKELFNVKDAAESIFILNANRYNERKDIATTIHAFAQARDSFNKSAYLCLHTPNLKPDLRQQLEMLISNSGCEEWILLNPLGENYVDDTMLRKLYQACAIGINTSLGEGWGMISFEHAACGAAQLVPGHTAQMELWKDAAIIIQIENPVQLSTNPFRMYRVREDEIAKQLEILVNDEKHLSAVSARCRENACRNKFNWKNISLLWKGLLE